MELYNGIICVTYDELTSARDGEPVMGKSALKMAIKRHPELRVSRAGGLGTCARIDYYKLRECYRQRFEERYGDPGDLLRKEALREQLKVAVDNDARKFFEDYTYEKGGRKTRLTEEIIREYTTNASVLNRLVEILDDTSVYRKALNGPAQSVEETIGEVYEEMRCAYGHTLPASIRRLQSKIRTYRQEGYRCLLSGKIGNSNTAIITPEAGRFIIALKRSSVPVYTNRQILDRYNLEVEAVNRRNSGKEGFQEWKPLKSLQSLTQYLKRPDIEPLWYDAVHGELASHQRYSRKNQTSMPSMRDSLWYGDGTKLNLYYKEWVDGKGWQTRTMQVYEVIDAYSEVMLGYHISDNEDYEAQYHAYRMAIQTSGHKPYELVHDNQGGHKKIGAFLDRIAAHVHRPTAPYSGQSKTIESVFGRFQAQVLHKDWRFTGQNITARKAESRPNLERIRANVDKLYTLQELKEAYAKARKEWNEGLHHATGQSRLEMYRSSVNPETPEVTVGDMVDMFWLTADRLVTYTDSGLRLTVKGKTYRYEVYGEDGMPDHGFLRENRGRKFIVRYDPYEPGSVRLYTKDPDGRERFARIAGTYFVVHRNIQEQTPEERAFILANIKANTEDRVARQIEGRVIEREHGTAMEQQGLRRPKLAGVTRQKDVEHEIDLEVRRRTRKYSLDPEDLSPGRVGKAISNMILDPIDGKIRIDQRRVAGKL